MLAIRNMHASERACAIQSHPLRTTKTWVNTGWRAGNVVWQDGTCLAQGSRVQNAHPNRAAISPESRSPRSCELRYIKYSHHAVGGQSPHRNTTKVAELVCTANGSFM